ncbi:sigma-54-dependent transcriptional regulator [Limnovirga soli]|uniref:Response regulator n=1 Tax=Limnovirga soli TaxID=2656915 RepID=A0A8J8FD80_9BACT|nr:sigma-54 dependent transcriptional regulator [Limnovirga soli]NNV54224.1 response regulator [Limnovirga soli]
MENSTIFIVEDNEWYGEMLKHYLSLNPQFTISLYNSGKSFIADIAKNPDILILDYSLPDTTGTELFKKFRKIHAEIPVIIISAQEDVSTAVNLLKLGVTDYIVKNEATKELLWNAVIKIKENQSLRKEIQNLREELGHKYNLANYIKGNSVAIKKVFTLIEKAIPTNINVSVTGETGTGKELVAKAIHFNSERKKKPFVAVNMAAIPRELIESELFGHEKGSFTGAVQRKIGKFEEANGGTLCLDEVAELDLSLQSKLLRVLQERELTRVGGNEKVKLDVRIIVATHKNLADEVKKGHFREDLYYRIIGLPIELPPLRERGSDILLLAKFFLDEFCKENKLSAINLSPSAKEKLVGYKFPGNIRELKALIDLAAVMSNGKEIEAEDILLTTSTNTDDLMSEEKTLKDYTCHIIQHFLKKYDNNVLKVADKLDIGKSTIYKMIQNHEIVV